MALSATLTRAGAQRARVGGEEIASAEVERGIVVDGEC